ncbi:MAG: hypothetical protein FP824_07825 [Euryarchaeota archaeon]|nr:hypothetical protein [Euryarchaeota archaeon]MBU4031990.1 hypothetical protein [Candidatus Thermoplasmatota archaeon]MBU4144283.1 hypothetical protein [Candidatus Thermoplasmatota archaeon]
MNDNSKFNFEKIRVPIILILVILVISIPFLPMINKPTILKGMTYFESSNGTVAIFFEFKNKLPILAGETITINVGAIYLPIGYHIYVDLSGSRRIIDDSNNFDYDYYTGQVKLTEINENNNYDSEPKHSWTHEGTAEIKLILPGMINAQIQIFDYNMNLTEVFNYDNLFYVDNSNSIFVQNISISSLVIVAGSILYPILFERKKETS